MLLLKLGYRSLWRNRRRTILTMTAMGAATMLMVLTLSIYEGIFQDMIHSATSFQGQIRVTAKGYFEDQEIDQTIPQEAFRQAILAYPGVVGITGRVRGFALLSYGEGDSSRAQAAELLGIDPEEEKTVSEFAGRVIRGRFISRGDSGEIVLGQGLARSLEAVVGCEIVAMGQDSYGSVAAGVFRVAGIVDTGDPVRDVSLALMERRTLQKMLALDDQLHEWALRLRSPVLAYEAAAGLQTELAGCDVRPWNRFLPQLNELLKLTEVTKYILALIFYFAVILVTVNTLYMALFERMREFAVMSAIGLRPARLAFMIVIEALLMSGIAGITGGITGFLAGLILQHHPIDISAIMPAVTFVETTLQPRVYAVPVPDAVFSPVCMVIVFGSLAALFPAWRLKRMRPADVLREV